MKDKYKIYLNALQCNRFYCNFIRSCDLGIDYYGVPIEISFTTNKEPTKEFIQKIIELLETSKNEQKLEWFFSDIKLKKVELVI